MGTKSTSREFEGIFEIQNVVFSFRVTESIMSISCPHIDMKT